ncbi:MAG: hypothetical protein HYX93_03300 [Chloroflexi bacterium]|nr:hypothetical protein [Chloroflexota bacterium]
MVTMSRAGQGILSAPRATDEALRQRIIEGFLERAKGLGIHPTPLTLKPLSRGLLGWLRPNESYRVGWHKQFRVSLLGLASFTISMPHQGTFTKHSADSVLMSVAAEALRVPLSTLREVEEVAVLAEEVDPILAVRVADRWFEVYRWLKRPLCLSLEEARHLARVVQTG